VRSVGQVPEVQNGLGADVRNYDSYWTVLSMELLLTGMTTSVAAL
jgi:hypothetical protein